jgi:prophage DNA circulation protein
MAAIFHGSGYETRSEAFLSAVLEGGVGVLSHPQYRKPINVVSVGTIDRFDGYASGTNQTIFAVTFYETTGLIIGGGANIKQSFDDLLDASAADFSANIQLDAVGDEGSFINQVKAVAKNIEAVLKTGSQGLAAATEGIENVGDSINRGIDLLVGKPLTLARQLQILIGEPARQLALSRGKLAAYGNLAASIFGGTVAEVSSFHKESLNNFHLNVLVSKVTVGVSALLASASADQLETKEDYIIRAETLQTLLADFQEWSDTNYQAIEVSTISEASIDTGGGVLALNDVVAIAVSSLLTQSFEAKNQMSMVLAAERTPIDLAYELYGSSDHDTMDLFIQSNNLGGDEYFLLPKGRQVVWYE